MEKPFNYGATVRSARRMIERFGSEIVINTTNVSVNPDPWKPGTGQREPTVTKGVFTSYEEKYIDGTVIRVGDQKVIFIAEDFPVKPNTSGTIKRGAEIWNIVKLMPINPGGTIIVYKAQVRM